MIADYAGILKYFQLILIFIAKSNISYILIDYINDKILNNKSLLCNKYFIFIIVKIFVNFTKKF